MEKDTGDNVIDFHNLVPGVDMDEINELLTNQELGKLMKLLPSIVRMELLAIKPIGTQWSPHVVGIINRLTEEGSLSIMTDIVTKDSDGLTA